MIPRVQNRPPRELSDAYLAAEKEFITHGGAASPWSGTVLSYRHGVRAWCFWGTLLLLFSLFVCYEMIVDPEEQSFRWVVLVFSGVASLLGAFCLIVLLRRAWRRDFVSMSVQGLEVYDVVAWKAETWLCTWDDIISVSLSDSSLFLQLAMRDGSSRKIYLPLLSRKERSMLFERIFLQMGPTIQEDGNT